MIPDLAIRLIQKFEGFSAVPYRDTGGVWTIGYGSTRGGDGRPVDSQSASLSRAEASNLLERDAERSAAGLARLTTRVLAPHEVAALVSFAYNLGVGAYQSSTLRRRVNERRDGEAAKEFLRWVHDNGRVIRGLVIRRTVESSVFLGDERSLALVS